MVRIGGLASGMDIDSLVKDLMKAERMPLDKLKQKKQTLEWQRDDYRSINTMLLNFRTELTQMKLSSKYRDRSTSTTNDARVTATATSAASLASYSISKVDQLASAATKVNTGSISKDGTKIDLNKSLYAARDDFSTSKMDFEWKTGSVEQKTINVKEEGKTAFTLELESGIQVKDFAAMNVKVNGVSYEVITTAPAEGLGSNQVLVDASGNLTFKEPIAKGSSIQVDYAATNRVEKLSLSEGATTFSLSKGAIGSIESFKIGSTEYSIASDRNNNIWEIKDVDGNVAGTLDSLTGKVTLNTPVAGDTTAEVSYTQKYFSFNVGSHTSKGLVSENFLIQGTESLNAVISKVNTSDAGVTMFYDSFKDQMTLTRKETGNFNGLDSSEEGFKDPLDPTKNQEIITSGGFINTVLKFGAATETGGENAKFTINGLETERSSNNFEISGVSFTLKQTFSDTPVSISVSNNTEQIFENIKGFVDKYNELIGKIQGEVQEERYKSYTPLTDEQREQLSDKQQEQWEEKAKSGMLRRDPVLSSLLSKMRMDFYTPVNNDQINPVYKQLASIGIKTTVNYLEGGKLEINEAELKKAIEADPASVEKLFNATGSSNGERGIVQRLYDTVNADMDKLKQKAGNSFSTNAQFEIGKQLSDLDKRIDRFEDKMLQAEDRYWRQFTAMEKAIQRSNEQSIFLMNQFGG